MIANFALQAQANPTRPSLALEQAVAALRAGNPAEAEQTLRVHLLQHPHDASALAKLAEVLLDQDRRPDAIMLLRRALQAAPEAHGIRHQLARLLYEQGEPHSALEQVKLLPAPLRSTFDVKAFEAMLLGILGRHDPEIEIYEDLISRQPAHPALWTSLGNALKYAGHGSKAAGALRKAVKLRPSYGEGWWSLANLKSAKFDDRDIAAMRKEIHKKPGPEDALHLNFALGKALEDRKLYAESFRHYDAGNRLRSASIPAEQMAVTRFVTESLVTFDAELMARSGTIGDQARDPIFIVGLQRSGSTLIEQILASHPLIEGTSELMTVPQLWAELVRAAESRGKTVREHLLTLPASAFAAMGADYLERTRPFRASDKPYFVDKLPANWMHIGFIRLMLPNARIVDARRHPMACGFSNFKQHYAAGVAFAYSQESIGVFYRDYLRLMRHFEQGQPGLTHLVVNESLIAETEAEVRRLLEYVGVPFDQSCLDFHQNKRAVNTPSAEQVRQPVNRDGVDYWRHYEPWLTPMKRALGPALVDWT